MKTPINKSVTLKSSVTAGDKLCRQILSELKRSNFNKEDIFAIHLALEEAFINAVTHGNKMDPDKEIFVDYSISPDRIEFSITDQGNGFDPGIVPDPRCGENLYKPEGRGLLLIQSYMDVVEYNERGNRVHMVKDNSEKQKQ